MPTVNEHDLILIGARVRLAEIDAEAAELRALLDGAAPADTVSGPEPVSEARDSGGPPRRLHWRQDPANKEKIARAQKRARQTFRKRRLERR